MAILQPKFAKKQKHMPKCSMLKCLRDIYPGRIDMIIYHIYKLVDGFLAKLVIRASISFFERGAFQNRSIPFTYPGGSRVSSRIFLSFSFMATMLPA